ncbi:MAG: DMT family transporter [Thiolinea sp.]
MSSEQTKADLAMVLATFLASLGWMFSGTVLQGMPPLLFIGLRFFISGLILLPFGWQKLSQLGWTGVRISLPAGLIFSVAIIFWILGLKYSVHVGVGAFLLSLNFLLVPLVAFWWGERPDRLYWFSLPVASLGVLCLFQNAELAFGLGEVFFALSAVGFALFLNLNRALAQRIPAFALVSLQQLMVGGVILLVSLFFEVWSVSLSTAILGSFLGSVLISTCGRFMLQSWAQRRTSAVNVALILLLEPVWVALLALFWLGQGMSVVQVLGCLLIFSAVLLSRSKVMLGWWRSRRSLRMVKPSA